MELYHHHDDALATHFKRNIFAWGKKKEALALKNHVLYANKLLISHNQVGIFAQNRTLS